MHDRCKLLISHGADTEILWIRANEFVQLFQTFLPRFRMHYGNKKWLGIHITQYKESRPYSKCRLTKIDNKRQQAQFEHHVSRSRVSIELPYAPVTNSPLQIWFKHMEQRFWDQSVTFESRDIKTHAIALSTRYAIQSKGKSFVIMPKVFHLQKYEDSCYKKTCLLRYVLPNEINVLTAKAKF